METSSAKILMMILAAILLAVTAMGSKCSGKKERAPETKAPPQQTTAPEPDRDTEPPPAEHESARKSVLEGGPFPALLMVQSQFIKKDGKSVPGPAVLDIVRKKPDGWEEVVVEERLIVKKNLN